MPYVPNSPPVGKIAQPDADQALTKYHILKVEYILKPGEEDKTILKVKWAKGYESEGVFIPVQTGSGTWNAAEDEDLVSTINKVTTGGTIYGETKTAVWDFLLTKGVIESGTIS